MHAPRQSCRLESGHQFGTVRALADHQQSRTGSTFPNRLPKWYGIKNPFVLVNPAQQHRVKVFGQIH